MSSSVVFGEASRLSYARAATPVATESWLLLASGTMPALARTIVDRVRAELPEYGSDPSGQVFAEAEYAVGEALRCFMRSLVTGRMDDPEHDEVFRRLGRLEAASGRSHDTLQAAYRIGSQAMMQHLLSWEQEFGASRQALAKMSSAVFDFIDHIATLSAEGYAQARGVAAFSRARLLALLVQRVTPPTDVLAKHAARLGWSLPESAAVIEVRSPKPLTDNQLGLLAARLLGPAALGGRAGARQLLLAPGPVDVRSAREHLDAAAPALAIAVGPHVELGRLADSAALAHQALTLCGADERVVVCDDQLLALVLDSGRDALALLAPARLAPLEELSPAKRVKYGRLLSAWLEFGSLHGSAPGVLDKHRQTLRYQQQQLERMFGEQLTDRDARVELMLLLRAALPRWEAEARPRPRHRTPSAAEFVHRARTPA